MTGGEITPFSKESHEDTNADLFDHADAVTPAGGWRRRRRATPDYNGETVRNSWNSVKRVSWPRPAEKMPAQQSSTASKPTPEVRSFGELVGHLANETLPAVRAAEGAKANPMARRWTSRRRRKGRSREGDQRLERLTAMRPYAAAKDDPEDDFSRRLPRRAREHAVSAPCCSTSTHDNEHYGKPMITFCG